jgi:hypothetical protein
MQLPANIDIDACKWKNKMEKMQENGKINL